MSDQKLFASDDPTRQQALSQERISKLAQLKALCQEQAVRRPLVNHILIEITDPPALKNLPWRQWPQTLNTELSGGMDCRDEGELKPSELPIELPACRSLLFGTADTLGRFTERVESLHSLRNSGDLRFPVDGKAIT